MKKSKKAMAPAVMFVVLAMVAAGCGSNEKKDQSTSSSNHAERY